ncbi:hypothetical protein Neosp_015075 [[Neocosmospora] mangrovei]
MSVSPSTRSGPVVPAPYNKYSGRIIKAFKRIFEDGGQWPWEMLGKYGPEDWGQSAVEELAKAVSAVQRQPKHGVTMAQLKEYLIQQIRKDKKPKFARKHAIAADKWISKEATTCSKRTTRANDEGGTDITEIERSLRPETPRRSSDMMDVDHDLHLTSEHPANTSPSTSRASLEQQSSPGQQRRGIGQENFLLGVGHQETHGVRVPESIEDASELDRNRNIDDHSNNDNDQDHGRNHDDDAHDQDNCGRESLDITPEEDQLDDFLESCRDNIKRFNNTIRKEEETIANLDLSVQSLEEGHRKATSKKAEAITYAMNQSMALQRLKQLVDQHSDYYPPTVQSVITNTEELFERAQLAKEKAIKVCLEVLEKLNKARQIQGRAEKEIAIYRQEFEACQQEMRKYQATLAVQHFRRLEEDNFDGMSPEDLSQLEMNLRRILTSRSRNRGEGETDGGGKPT